MDMRVTCICLEIVRWPIGEEELLQRAKKKKEEILYADIDLKQLTKARLDIHYLKDRRPDSYKILSEYTEY